MFWKRRRIICLVSILLVVSGMWGCERARELLGDGDEPTGPPPESVEFGVDAKGVLYGTLMEDGKLVGADKLARVPLAERAAVVVHVSGETPQIEGRYYVADLVEARPGDRKTARLRSGEDVRTLLATGEQAALRGLAVRNMVRHMLDAAPADGSGASGPVRRKSESAPADQGFEDRAIALEMEKDDPIELFEEAELTSKESGVATAGGEGGDIEIHRLSGTGPSSTRSRGKPIAGGSSWRSVTMYTADWCGVCKRAKRWLDKNSVPYNEVDVDLAKSNKLEMMRFARRNGLSPNSVPTFRIGDDRAMQGWRVSRFKRLARR